MNFVGRAGNLLLFAHEGGGVIIDSEFDLVVASGRTDVIKKGNKWGAGEFTETQEQLAAASLQSIDTAITASVGRQYTIPRGVQMEAKLALEKRAAFGIGGTPVDRVIANRLAKGGQIGIGDVRHLAAYFERHRNDIRSADSDFSRSLRGGSAAQRWATTIAEREPLTAAAGDDLIVEGVNDFRDAYEMDETTGPEFLARVRLDGSGMDRLYKIDFDGQTYVWDDSQWDNLGHVDADIWTYDSAMDDPYDTVEKSHIVIDPDSAVLIGARLAADPDTSVTVEELDEDEARLAAQALPTIDWDIVDSTVLASAREFAVGDGIDTPEEKSERAQTQVRDATGKFAKTGSRVMVGGDPARTGEITRVNPQAGSVSVLLDSGESIDVPGQSVESVGKYTTTVPGEPVEIPRVDMTGILAEPRTPVNRVGAQLPGTLPQMTRDDLHTMINDFPAYVQKMRAGMKGVDSPSKVDVQAKDSLDKGARGDEIERQSGTKLTTDAYKHPLISDWLKRKNRETGVDNETWYEPITAAAAAEGDDTATGEMTPETADVSPVYMAVVAPEDPRAVLDLVSLVPASAESTAPMTYTREEGEWVRNEQMLADLKSATPPPVVPLDSETLNDVLKQVDGDEPVAQDSPAAQPAPTPVVASIDQTLMILWGPNVPNTAITAAGGFDRNQGNAEKLRRYWVRGEGAAKIRWGTPGDWRRCVRYLSKHMTRAQGYCQLRHKEATGIYTGDDKNASEKELSVVERMREFTQDDNWTPPQDIIDAMREVDALPDEEFEALVAAGGADRNAGDAEKLRRYWTWGAGGAKIRWGSGGDWTRCVRYLSKYLGPRAKGYCALRHKEMTGQWTGDQRHRQTYGRAAGPVFSNEILDTLDAINERSFLNAKAQDAKERMGLVASAPPGATGASFIIPLVMPEELESGDGRVVKAGATEVRNLPLPLMWQIKSGDGHSGSVVVGRIDYMERTASGIGNAHGVFDTGPYGREAERLVRNGFLRGVSADMDKFEAQEEAEIELPEDADEAADAEDLIKKERLIISKARIMGVTIVPKPAFQECIIMLSGEEPQEGMVIMDDVYDEGVEPVDSEVSLVACGYVASAIPVTPPVDWFADPKLKSATPLTVDDDGRVYGHIAAWSQNHIGYQKRTNPPRSRSKYAYFHTGVVRTDIGKDIPVGQLTLAGGHADLFASATEAVKHYDDTASAVADVHAGEDRFGIWVAGALRPGVTPEQIRVLRASAPSGDWRPVNGSLELVAVCQVNVPGFPTTRAMVASGTQEVYALVAAGVAPLVEIKAHRATGQTFSAPIDLESRVQELQAKFMEVKTARNAELSAKSEALSERFHAALDEFANVSTEKRERLAKEGKAMKDGSYPIASVSDLKKAIRAFGRAKESDRAAVKRHIIKRARALKRTDLIPDKWKPTTAAAITASLESMQARIAAAQSMTAAGDPNLTDEEKRLLLEEAKKRDIEVPEKSDAPEKAPVEEAPEESTPGDGGAPVAPTQSQVVDPKYTPKTQPRDGQGRFRDILARLKSDLGVSGNQDVVEKLKQTENLDNAGDYEAASKAAGDLISTIDRLDSGALNAVSLQNVRVATSELGKVIANLPLPFENQAQKVRFSDLPPALRQLAEDLVKKVEAKIGDEEGSKATDELKSFMSGSDVYSQSEVSAQLNRMLRLLT